MITTLQHESNVNKMQILNQQLLQHYRKHYASSDRKQNKVNNAF